VVTKRFLHRPQTHHPHPLSPRARRLKSALAKLDHTPATMAEPFPGPQDSREQQHRAAEAAPMIWSFRFG
jgi:hypothetical protein